jgi:predicted O-linked N-acetylglucosamine transferase (SPINDLY family)
MAEPMLKPTFPEQNKPKPQAFSLSEAFRQAVTFHQQGQLAQAELLYQSILEGRPDHFDALHLLGIVRCQQARYDEAIVFLRSALAIEPTSAAANCDLGNALQALNRHDEAIASYDQALAIKPDHAETLNNRGSALQALNRHDEAIASYDQALAAQPDYVDALYNRGNALQDLSRHDEAIASYDKALAIRSDFADALNNRGVSLQDLGRHDEAVASYDKALAIRPDFADAFNNRGVLLQDLGRYDEAVASYEKVLAIEPGYPYAFEVLFHQKQLVCDWSDLESQAAILSGRVRDRKSFVGPWVFVSSSRDPGAQLLCARQYVADMTQNVEMLPRREERYAHSKIRIAYLSADFREHAVAYLTAELFEQHDRSGFEVTGVSCGPDDKSEMRARLKAGFDRFLDVREKSDIEVAQWLRDNEIDIAVDLTGHTRSGRLKILACRPAPIQVNYLGYPGTMGASFIDYILADEFIVPRSARVHYSEKVVYLPDCYQVNDSKRKIAERTPTRSEAGLPGQGFVFCCFNTGFKITPAFFDVWMRLLRRVEGSVLWLLGGNTSVESNLRREAAKRGVAPDRLVFAPRLKYADYLARYRLADLFLDTLPYNAGATASDALWAGLPVLTCSGEAFAARMAGSLLRAVGLPELVTDTLEQYEALALKLARDGRLLHELREKLRQNRSTAPLFDTRRFRRHIEAAYRTMWEIWQSGEQPRSFAVESVEARPQDDVNKFM